MLDIPDIPGMIPEEESPNGNEYQNGNHNKNGHETNGRSHKASNESTPQLETEFTNKHLGKLVDRSQEILQLHEEWLNFIKKKAGKRFSYQKGRSQILTSLSDTFVEKHRGQMILLAQQLLDQLIEAGFEYIEPERGGTKGSLRRVDQREDKVLWALTKGEMLFLLPRLYEAVDQTEDISYKTETAEVDFMFEKAKRVAQMIIDFNNYYQL